MCIIYYTFILTEQIDEKNIGSNQIKKLKNIYVYT